MTNKKQNIAGLIRELLNKNTSDKIYKDILEQLLALTYDYLKRFNIKSEFEEIAKDTRNTALSKILESLNKDIWKNTIIRSNENDKRINSYIYTIIKESYRDISDKSARKESEQLYQSVKKITKSLVQSGFLNKNENEYFTKSPNIKCTDYSFNYSYNRYYIDLRRGEKGQLDQKKLKDFIQSVFDDDNLENLCFSISDLTKLISENSNYGVFIEKRVNRFEVSTDTDDGIADNSVILESSENSDNLINKTLVNKWLIKFKKIWDEDEIQTIGIMIVLFFSYNYTYKKIKDFLNRENISDISSLQTIKNKIDKSILDVCFNELKDDRESMKLHLEFFLKKLEKDYVSEEVFKMLEVNRDE